MPPQTGWISGVSRWRLSIRMPSPSPSMAPRSSCSWRRHNAGVGWPTRRIGVRRPAALSARLSCTYQTAAPSHPRELRRQRPVEVRPELPRLSAARISASACWGICRTGKSGFLVRGNESGRSMPFIAGPAAVGTGSVRATNCLLGRQRRVIEGSSSAGAATGRRTQIPTLRENRGGTICARWV